MVTNYWHEGSGFATRFAVEDKPRKPPHPTYPWVLGPDHAPPPAPRPEDAPKPVERRCDCLSCKLDRERRGEP